MSELPVINILGANNGDRDRAWSRSFAFAGFVAALALGSGCADADTHGVSGDGIAVFSSEKACSLRAEGSASSVVL